MAIPGRELVGKNAQVTDKEYNDDYLRALNQFATVDEVFGQHRKDIAAGGDSVARVVMGTLDRVEYENHLVALVMTAAKEGEWKAVFRHPYRHAPGLDVVEQKHFGHVVKQGEKTFLLPSAMYLAYCKEELSQKD